MEPVDEGGDVPSQQCSNCESSLARCWCLDCNEALCDDCVSAHRRVSLTRWHRLQNQASDDSGFVSPTKFCKVHPSESLKLFCVTCVQLTCRDCQLESHKNHSFRFVGGAMEGVNRLLKKQLDAYLQLLGDKMEAAAKSLQDMETRLKFLTQCAFIQTADLQRVFKMLVLFLKRRIEVLLKEIQKAYESERELVTRRMLTVQRLQESHRSLREVCEKAQNSTDPLVLMSYIEQMKLRLKDLVDQDSSPPQTMTNVIMVTDGKFLEGLVNFGKIKVSWIPFSVSETLLDGMEKLPAPSVSSLLTETPPTSSQPPTCNKTNSNTAFSPVSSGTSSTTTSSCSSIQSESSSKTSPGAVPSVPPSYPPLSSMSNICSSFTDSNPSIGKNPVSQVRSGSASLSSLTSSVPPVSSLGSPAHTEPRTRTTTAAATSTLDPSGIISAPSQSSARPGTPTKRPGTPTKHPETLENYTTTNHLEALENYTTSKCPGTLENYTNTNHLEALENYTTSKCPGTLKNYTTTKRPETTIKRPETTKRAKALENYTTTTKHSETSEKNTTSTDPCIYRKFNILTKSQLELDSGKFFFTFKYKTLQTSRTSGPNRVSPGGKTTSFRLQSSGALHQLPAPSQNHQSSGSVQQSSGSVQQSSGALHQLPAPSQNHQSSGSVHQLPAPSQNQQSSGALHQLPAPSQNHQSSGAVHQSSGALHQVPAPSQNHQSSRSVHQSSGSVHQSSGALHQLPTPSQNHQSSGSVHQSSGSVHQSSGALHQLPTPSQKQQSVMLQTNTRSSISSSTCDLPSSSPVLGLVCSNLHLLPSSNKTKPVQQSLVLNQLYVPDQTQSSVVLMTNPQPSVSLSHSSCTIIPSSQVQALPSLSSYSYYFLPQTFSSTGQPLTSTLLPVAGPNLPQSPLGLNQQLVLSQNPSTLAQLKNTQNVYPVSDYGHNHPTALPQFPALQNSSALHSMSTVQNGCFSSQFSPDSVGSQVILSTTKNVSSVTQCSLTSSVQQSGLTQSVQQSGLTQSVQQSGLTQSVQQSGLTQSVQHYHQNQTSNSRPSLQQNLESEMVVGSNHGVQDQEMQQESEVNKRPICVSESAVLEFRENRPLQKLSSSGTPQIRETAALSEEIYQAKQNLISSEQINLIVGQFSPPPSDIKLTTTSLEETNPRGNLSSSKAHDVGPDITKSEGNTFLDGLFSPISSDDELSIDPPEEPKPTGRPSSPEMNGFERVPVKPAVSERGLFSPVSSEDEFPVVLPEDTGGQSSQSEETDPPRNQPSPKRHDDQHVPVKSFSPGSSDDERTIGSSEDDDPAPNLSASESDDEDKVSPSPKTRQQDFSQPQWQPQVSLIKLPLSIQRPGSPESRFQFLLEESEEELHLLEYPASSNVSDDSTNDDFLNSPSSPGCPLSVEVISCSACASPNASKICSDCGRGYHSDCHVPPVGPDIWSEWICSLCQDLTDPSDPYSSDRSQSPEPAHLSVQDQRRCETLLLHLKVEGCGPFSELEFWTKLMFIAERLTHCCPPYQTAAQLVSDLWCLFQDVSQDQALLKLQQSFQKKLVEVLGGELHPSLLMAPGHDGGPAASAASDTLQHQNTASGSKLTDLRKRLRDFLVLNTSPAAKRAKKS